MNESIISPNPIKAVLNANSISKHFGKSTSDLISNAITTSISQAELQSLNHVGKAMVNNSTNPKTKKPKDSRTVNKSNAVVQNVHIHAFGAW